MHLLHGGSIFLEGLLPCGLESAFYWTEQQKCFLVFFCCFFLTSWQIWCTWWRWRQNWNLNFQSKSFCHKSNLCTVSKWDPVFMATHIYVKAIVLVGMFVTHPILSNYLACPLFWHIQFRQMLSKPWYSRHIFLQHMCRKEEYNDME